MINTFGDFHSHHPYPSTHMSPSAVPDIFMCITAAAQLRQGVRNKLQETRTIADSTPMLSSVSIFCPLLSDGFCRLETLLPVIEFNIVSGSQGNFERQPFHQLSPAGRIQGFLNRATISSSSTLLVRSLSLPSSERAKALKVVFAFAYGGTARFLVSLELGVSSLREQPLKIRSRQNYGMNILQVKLGVSQRLLIPPMFKALRWNTVLYEPSKGLEVLSDCQCCSSKTSTPARRTQMSRGSTPGSQVWQNDSFHG